MNLRNRCIFCKIAHHESPADIVYEDDAFVAFYDIHPEAPTHVLVIPKEHVEKMTDLHDHTDKEGLLLDLWKTTLNIAHKLGIEDACKIQVNNGSKAGQIVPHLHIHLLSQKGTSNQ